MGGFQNKDMNSPEELKTRAAVGTAKECVGGGKLFRQGGKLVDRGFFARFAQNFPL